MTHSASCKVLETARFQDVINANTGTDEFEHNVIPYDAFTATIASRVHRFLSMGLSVGTVVDLTGKNERKMASLIASARLLISQNELQNDALQRHLLTEMVDLKQNNRIYKLQPVMAMLAVMLDPSMVKNVEVRRAVMHTVPIIVTSLSDIYAFMGILKISGRTSGALVMKSLRAAILENATRAGGVESYVKGQLKFKQRDGWSYKDVLRLSHTNLQDIPYLGTLPNQDMHAVIKFTLGQLPASVPNEDPVKARLKDLSATYSDYCEVRETAERLSLPEAVSHAVQVLSRGYIDHDMIPNGMLVHSAIWKACLDREASMSPMAVVRNLANMTRAGVFDDPQYEEKTAGLIASIRGMHPMRLFLASYAYSKLSWSSDAVHNALEAAFVHAFSQTAPNPDVRVMHNIDLSASMYWESSRIGSTDNNPMAGEVAAAMAFITTRVEDASSYDIFGFGSHYTKNIEGTLLVDIDSHLRAAKVNSLSKALQLVRGMAGGNTNIGMSIKYALDNHIHYDAFVFWTDNDLNSGLHPVTVLREYRKQVNPTARLITVSLADSTRTIADPEDGLMIDLVGFDSNTPSIISDFVADRL